MMKTPDEIKKGLEWCINDTYGCNEKCPYFNSLSNGVDCAVKMHADALAYIRQLEAERNAAVEELRKTLGCCAFCKYYDANYKCQTFPKIDRSCWEWRGVQEEGNHG